ncbi:MAG: DUF4397 domain-containing protein [Rubrivivax sp.]
MTRSQMVRRGWAALITATTLLLAACGGGGNDSGGTAKLRVLNATSDTTLTSMDVYLGDSKTFSAATSDTLTAYADKSAESYTVKLTTAGSTTTLFTGAYTLSKDKNYTGVVWGRAGSLRFATLPEDDDTASISANSARVRVYNATANTGAVDVYLTLNDEELLDTTPVASAVASATLGGYRELSVGTYRLRVTGAGDTNDLRLDIPGVVLNLKEYSTIVLTAGPGNVLVNGAQLVQRGALTSLKNTKARLRVVAGAEARGSIGVSVAGTTFVGGLRAPTVGPYTLVNAGSPLVDVRLNGVSISSTNRTLTPGGDYTLLAYGSDGAGQVALLADDNRLPSAGTYRIRLVNAAATTAPLTLSVDFAALLSDIPSGSASAIAAGTANSSARLDVTSTSGIDSLYTEADVNLQTLGVYTVFVLGGNTTPTGVLRKDR